jgi:hypothetical protein
VVDDAGVDGLAGLGLGAPVRPGVLHGGEVPLEVHGGDGVELLLGGVDEHPVPHDAGVVDQHVQATERVDGGLDQALGLRPVRDVRTAGDGLAAGGDDLVDHALGGATTAGR